MCIRDRLYTLLNNLNIIKRLSTSIVVSSLLVNNCTNLKNININTCDSLYKNEESSTVNNKSMFKDKICAGHKDEIDRLQFLNNTCKNYKN